MQEPLSNHPNVHTDEEIKRIKDYTIRNPNINLSELYGKLELKKVTPDTLVLYLELCVRWVILLVKIKTKIYS